MALRFQFLTGARSVEVLRLGLRVPLSDRALEVLDGLVNWPWRTVGCSRRRTAACCTRSTSRSSCALQVDAVPCGFRSSFRDWAAEIADAPREVCELALAHVNGDRVEAA